MRVGTTSRVTAADRPYGEFYDFYSVSPENFGSTLVCIYIYICMPALSYSNDLGFYFRGCCFLLYYELCLLFFILYS